MADQIAAASDPVRTKTDGAGRGPEGSNHLGHGRRRPAARPSCANPVTTSSASYPESMGRLIYGSMSITLDGYFADADSGIGLDRAGG